MADLLFPLIDPQIRERKFQQREIDLDELTDEELRSRYRFGRESIKFLVEILKSCLLFLGRSDSLGQQHSGTSLVISSQT